MALKGRLLLNFCKCLCSKTIRRVDGVSPKYTSIFPLISFPVWFDPYNLYDKLMNPDQTNPKANLYWQKMSTEQLIDEADKLYDEGDYLQVYEILNRIKYNGNPEVQWRICRVLFRMSADDKFNAASREEMISEAYILIKMAFSLDKLNANIYKWLAIITDAKCGNDGLVHKIHCYKNVKAHMEKALELNPNDMVVLYMIGKWCYEMSRLTKFQRFIAMVLYADPPSSSYREAYDYLVRSVDLQEKEYYIPTYYVLGKTCIKLRQYFRARYYLHRAALLPARNEYEARCAKKAKFLVTQLDKYDVEKDSIFSDFQNFTDQV